MSTINNINSSNIGNQQNEIFEERELTEEDLEKIKKRKIQKEFKSKVEKALNSSIVSTSELESPYKNKKIKDLIKETFNSDFDFDKKISELKNFIEDRKKYLDTEFVNSSTTEEIENLEEILKFLEKRKISISAKKNTFEGIRNLNSSERKILDTERGNISNEIGDLEIKDKDLEEQEETLLKILKEIRKKRDGIQGEIDLKKYDSGILSNRISLLDEGLNENKKEFIISKNHGNDIQENLQDNNLKEESVVVNNNDNLKEDLLEIDNNEKEEELVEVDNTDNSKEESLEVNNEKQEKNEDKEVNQDTIDKIISGNNGFTSRIVNEKIDIEQESKKYENTPLRSKISYKGKKALSDFKGKNLKHLNKGSSKNFEGNENLIGELENSEIDKYLSEANSIKIEIEKIKDLLTDKEIEIENGFKRGLTVEEFQKDILIIEDEIDNIKNKIESFKKELSEKGLLENENFSEIREFLEENDLENIFENFMNKIFEKYEKNESGKLESKEDKIYESLINFSQVFEGFDKNNLTSEEIEEIWRCEQAIEILEGNGILDKKYNDIISKLKNKIASFEINKSEEKTTEIEENNVPEKTELSEVEKQALTEIQGVDEFYNNEENSRKFGNRIFNFISSILGVNKEDHILKHLGYKKFFYDDIEKLSKVNFSYKTMYEDEKLNKSESIKDILQKNLENFKKFFGIEEKMKNFFRVYEQNVLLESLEVISDSEKSLKELSENQIFTLNEEELIEFEERFNQILAKYEKALQNIKNSLENLDDIEKQEVILSCEKEIAYIKKEISENKEKYKTSLINKDLNNQTENQSSNDKRISEIDFPKPTITRLATPASIPVVENVPETKEIPEYKENFPKNLFYIPEVGNSFSLQGNEYFPGVKEGKGWTGGTMYTFSEFKDGKPNGLTVIYTTTGIKKMEGIYENGKMINGLHFDEKGKVTKKTVDGKTTKV